jgi:hypothetical protein
MRFIILSCLLFTNAFAQTAESSKETPKDSPSADASESPAIRATRHSFMLVSTRAIALFRSADTIEARLQATGATLRPSTTTLRLRIEHTLDQIEAAIDKGDLTRADEHIKAADELVSRFARRIGGE